MTTENRRHYGRTRTGTTRHIISGVSGWYSGMTLNAECGARIYVSEEKAPPGFVTLPAGTCRKCAAALGCRVEAPR